MNPSAGRLLAAAARVPVEARADPDAWRDAAIRRALADGGDPAELAAAYDALLLLAPANGPDGAVRLRPAGSGVRRHRGAFATPPGYAADLARRALPEPARGALPGRVPPLVPSVVDPACGAGALLRAALARLLALGVPPVEAGAALHGVDCDPVAVELARAALAADLTAAGHRCRPGDLGAQLVVGDALSGLDWAAAFPAALARPGRADPVTGWSGGFDAVLANPPWERLKVHARDWPDAPPAGLRADRAAHAAALRAAGRHPLTGAGELNAYLPFVETCWQLLASDGRAALLVPAGIASDRSAARLIHELVRQRSLRRLDLIDPPGPVFAGVNARVGVAVLELAAARSGGGSGAARAGTARVAIGLAAPDEPPGEREFALSESVLATVNPNTRTAPLFGSAADAALVTAVHRRVPVLTRHGAENPWRVRLVTSLHMTRDARWFTTAPGPGRVPLFEAKHCGLLDPHGGSVPGHRYWVPAELMAERYPALVARGWLAGFRNVATTASPRTLLPTPIPVAGVGNSLPLLFTEDAALQPLLLAALASLPVDYLLRQRHAGANVNFFKLEQVPVPPPSVYLAPAPWDPGTTVADWVRARLAAAIVWPPRGLEVLAAELGAEPAAADPGAGPASSSASAATPRAVARAEMDAAHAVLLGLDRAELTQVLSTFPALRQRELHTSGRFVTAELALSAFDRLAPS